MWGRVFFILYTNYRQTVVIFEFYVFKAILFENSDEKENHINGKLPYWHQAICASKVRF